MTWHPRDFSNLEAGEIVEFYALGVDPNRDPQAKPRWNLPVQIQTEAHTPDGDNGPPTGLMVRAGKNGNRVRNDEYQAWIKTGGYRGRPLG